ncbi:MAG TPA: ATP-binding cassette domain-containing protein [Streptosporangiaceae bacterium]|jgi:ABC-2 type transport system ATP-binding protein
MIANEQTVAAVEVSNLRRTFGTTTALDGASFTVGYGEIFGLLGPNGAGKTTAIKILLALLRPTAGRARVTGIDVAVQPMAVRRRVGWVPQERTADPLLTTRENLRFMAGMYRLSAAAGRRRAEELLALTSLGDYADRLAGDLSGGTRRRLELAMGLVNVPAVLFLDEPTLGLDITARRSLWSYVRAIRQSGTTIVLTTHYLEEADALCDRVAIIDHGRICADGTPAELKAGLTGAGARASLEDVFLAATGQELIDQPVTDQLVGR